MHVASQSSVRSQATKLLFETCTYAQIYVALFDLGKDLGLHSVAVDGSVDKCGHAYAWVWFEMPC